MARNLKVEALRRLYPHQVIIRNWGQYRVTRPPKLVERIHGVYGGASWRDEPDSRTFGFTGSSTVRLFIKQWGGEEL